MSCFQVLRHACLVSFFAVLFCSAVIAQDKEWRPISPQELSVTAPTVEPNADAEALFWEVRIDDSSDEDLSLKHYVRVKIFTEKGREQYSKFDIPYRKGTKIKDLQARVIKADGTTVEIRKEDIFEREIVKASGVKIKAKSFAVPNIEPGVIIEYRYKETINDAGAKGMRLQFQRDIPVQTLSYYYKPYNSREPKYQSYNFKDGNFVKDKNGFYLATRTNVPAFKDEPRMPPEDMVKPWMLLTGSRLTITNASAYSFSYVVKDPNSPSRYWGAVSAEQTPLIKFINKPSGDIRKLAAEITAGAATDDEKLRKLYTYCQSQIRNTTMDPSITDDQRAKLPQIKSFSDVIKNKAASAQWVDMLFGAFASSVGFEARVAFTGNRNEMFFVPEMTNEDLVHPAAIALKIGDDYKFFNPGMELLPYGMLTWFEEDAWGLLVGSDNFMWHKTPFTDKGDSVEKRTGKFKLLDDGTLEGDVSIEYTGQLGVSRKLDGLDDSANKREQDIKDGLARQISTAEVSNISIENISDPT
ncbi:MAG TPA: DUF3857 domain-containing protein, partial [Pyrinomonadaceae bacterium]|nr:DUF3857 domain-containing protein [Pyrinomonadaceae bacterium]